MKVLCQWELSRQNRILEIYELPPDILKLSRQIVQGAPLCCVFRPANGRNNFFHLSPSQMEKRKESTKKTKTVKHFVLYIMSGFHCAIGIH